MAQFDVVSTSEEQIDLAFYMSIPDLNRGMYERSKRIGSLKYNTVTEKPFFRNKLPQDSIVNMTAKNPSVDNTTPILGDL